MGVLTSSTDLYGYALHSYGLYGYGLHSYGLCSYGHTIGVLTPSTDCYRIVCKYLVMTELLKAITI